MVVDFIRRVSWHDAKTPPPVHDESWENAGEKHCCIMSELVWVCCESRNTMKGWIENGKWYIEETSVGIWRSIPLWSAATVPPSADTILAVRKLTVPTKSATKRLAGRK